jgi:O-acetyl-ADP-ribose deacetylase (regulator of RNase III)
LGICCGVPDEPCQEFHIALCRGSSACCGYDAKNAAATVQGDLNAFKTSTDETFKAYTKTTDLDNYIGTRIYASRC